MEADDLTGKQERFCQEYIIDFNATRAATEAGYSEHTAQQIGSENLCKPLIQNRIAQLKAKRAKKVECTAEMVLSELMKMGFSNVQDFTDNTNGVVNVNSVDRDKAAAIKEIETKTMKIGEEGDNEVTFTKVKFHDKIKALENIARHIGFFKEDNNQKGNIDLDKWLKSNNDSSPETL